MRLYITRPAGGTGPGELVITKTNSSYVSNYPWISRRLEDHKTLAGARSFARNLGYLGMSKASKEERAKGILFYLT